MADWQALENAKPEVGGIVLFGCVQPGRVTYAKTYSTIRGNGKHTYALPDAFEESYESFTHFFEIPWLS